jgi:hypothetical protein
MMIGGSSRIVAPAASAARAADAPVRGDTVHGRAAESAQADFVQFQPRFQPPDTEPARNGTRPETESAPERNCPAATESPTSTRTAPYMPPIRILALLLAFTVPACVPVASHGPRVEPGGVAGTIISLGTRPTLEGEVKTGQSTVTPVVPPMGFFARFGTTPDDAGPPVPVAAGVFVPLALPFSISHPELDVYAQLTPAPWPVAGSAGALVSRSYVSPYVQLGRDVAGGHLYTTQGMAFFGGAGPSGRVWMPAVAMQWEGVHLFAQGGLGSETLTDDGGFESTRSVRFLMGGVVVHAPFGPGLLPF